MRVLGISAFFHDSAAALVIDGDVCAAAQEERFTRKKHDARFPRHAVRFCLAHAGLTLDEIDVVAFYDKPFLKFERLLETYHAFAPRGFASFKKALPLWLREKLFLKDHLERELARELPGVNVGERLVFSEHHLSHAASAFYPSPFDDAVVLTLDGVGEWATSSVAIGDGPSLAIHKEQHFPHSLGLLYAAFTHHLGFKINSGEYKVMGLAPYGEPRFAQRILDDVVDVKADGSFRLNLDLFDYAVGLTMTNARFDALFDAKRRAPDEPLSAFHMDMAASVQSVTEEIVLRMTRALAAETGKRFLCLAGGVALNCVANGKVLRDGRFERIWAQPAAGDAGGALGAALVATHLLHGVARPPRPATDGMHGAYLGPVFDDDETALRLRALGARFHVVDDETLIEHVVEALVAEKAVGFMQDRMEFGPRALGARSILADPRSTTMQKTLNLRVKYRESFRPFAPAVLREDVNAWFELDVDSPYMMLVAPVTEPHRRAMSDDEKRLFGIEKLNVPRSDIPAVTHVDYSARVQTVHKETNPRFHALLTAWKARTGCPVLVNTSFNVRGEPIVCTPDDAFRCFMGSEIETLVVGNTILHKSEQNPALKVDTANAFDPD
jgi:carbamoyltransferase